MQIATLFLKILLYNNLRWSAIDLHYSANSQNCQIVQDGPAYNQLILLNINY